MKFIFTWFVPWSDLLFAFVHVLICACAFYTSDPILTAVYYFYKSVGEEWILNTKYTCYNFEHGILNNEIQNELFSLPLSSLKKYGTLESDTAVIRKWFLTLVFLASGQVMNTNDEN